MLRIWFASVFLFLSTSQAFAVAPMRYVYPPAETDADLRMGYYWELLRATLDETIAQYGPYELSAGPNSMNADRAGVALKRSTEITILTRTTSID